MGMSLRKAEQKARKAGYTVHGDHYGYLVVAPSGKIMFESCVSEVRSQARQFVDWVQWNMVFPAPAPTPEEKIIHYAEGRRTFCGKHIRRVIKVSGYRGNVTCPECIAALDRKYPNWRLSLGKGRKGNE